MLITNTPINTEYPVQLLYVRDKFKMFSYVLSIFDGSGYNGLCVQRQSKSIKKNLTIAGHFIGFYRVLAQLTPVLVKYHYMIQINRSLKLQKTFINISNMYLYGIIQIEMLECKCHTINSLLNRFMNLVAFRCSFFQSIQYLRGGK